MDEWIIRYSLATLKGLFYFLYMTLSTRFYHVDTSGKIVFTFIYFFPILYLIIFPHLNKPFYFFGKQ